ncbi:Hpt domain-containing protein [Alkalilacustris brevis]|uniref:Hpt domain-containing protein n=1 Tax=Alkalilacustris brevis TaxID=2026338 RepID=UPI000E0E04CE|nr:Hpt domain-containing protein [Alkalilacustris brevis]
MARSNDGDRNQETFPAMAASRVEGTAKDHGADLSALEAAEPEFRQEDFSDLVSLLGAKAVLLWIDELRTRLQGLISNGGKEPAVLQPVVHNIIGKAGMLGFRELAECCARLEQEMLSGRCLTSLEAVLREARRVDEALPRLKQTLRKQEGG